MAIYIDENILYKIIEEKYKNAKGDARKAYSKILDILCEIPTADVQEVRHGKWIGYPSITISKVGRTVQSIIYKCSCCGKSNGRAKSPYCKNCGSKMCGEGAEARFKELEDRK